MIYCYLNKIFLYSFIIIIKKSLKFAYFMSRSRFPYYVVFDRWKWFCSIHLTIEIACIFSLWYIVGSYNLITLKSTLLYNFFVSCNCMRINILILPLYFNKSSKAEYEHNITITDIIIYRTDELRKNYD